MIVSKRVAYIFIRNSFVSFPSGSGRNSSKACVLYPKTTEIMEFLYRFVCGQADPTCESENR